ncbi:hypothetical protein CG401_06940 [Bifidobacteriaceae bacterium NR019]|uniref:Uncharacterized protein n=2 Tax=Gardnerella TaxID=2701 RepID=A0AAP8LS85_GARVA|nr:hypothetical protein CYJ60_00085 [Gardnerella vaginalis]RFT28289.1 hypothetical protein CG404_06775 [Bifidobacteriaceae bacterium VN003]RFT32509.1 hypothetical protein CG401_06940 [Bifidobacteriaceae bacterium NR019]RFT35588.1 hypothetical protein CG400_03290 [Bifidobacteriaceae bacterium NR017]RIY24807.1 hypothetical protein CJI52_08780 [Bifidobacteriaceae bacterium WP022]RIY29459.1 hypothetical protein CJI48_05440 [Bifidobacteriaceae bacterium GH005]
MKRQPFYWIDQERDQPYLPPWECRGVVNNRNANAIFSASYCNYCAVVEYCNSLQQLSTVLLCHTTRRA